MMVQQGLISPTFYMQLLCAQNPESAKNTDKQSVFFALMGSAHIKATHKMLVK